MAIAGLQGIGFGLPINAGFGMGGFAPASSFSGAGSLAWNQIVPLLQNMLVALQQLQAGYRQMMGGQVPQPRPAGPMAPIPQSPTRYAGPQAPAPSRAPATAPPDPRFERWAQASQNGTSQQVSSAERTSISQLNDQGRAVLHLWGRQITAGGGQDGSIYFNVLNDREGKFTPAEHALVERLYQQEMQTYGGVTGKGLDAHFFGLMKEMTGEDVAARYANSPVKFSDGRPVDLSLQATNNNGLGEFANGVLRLWGHDRLDNARNDGSILQLTLQNPNAFDKDLNKDLVRGLLAADVADGKQDGSSLATAFRQTLDQVYLGRQGGNLDQTLAMSGIDRTTVGSIMDRIKNNQIPGIPPGIDITNMQNIGRCPFFKGGVTQQVKING